MRFKKGNKLAKGGRRTPRGGRPTKQAAGVKQAARVMALEMIERDWKPVVKRYIHFALKDAATCRHFMDKLLPDQFDIAVPHSATFTITVRRQTIEERAPEKEPKRRPRSIKVLRG